MRATTASLRIPPRRSSVVISLLRCLASLQLAVVLLVLLAAVLAAATIVETYEGADAARWHVYSAPWFAALLGLLAVNILGAAVVRFPWQRHQTGFVVTHAGLLMLLIGAAISAWGSRAGQITLREGETASEMLLPNRSRVTAFRVGREEAPDCVFEFNPRPADWDASAPSILGEVDGVAVSVLEWIRTPRLVQEWVLDEAGIGGPAVRFKLLDAQGQPVTDAWLADQQFGETGEIGPLRMQLERAVNATMLADFEHPPFVNPEDRGLLLAYCRDDALRVPVDGNIGQRLPIGASGIEIEIVACLANARPDRLGQFASVDDRPRNPMLELRVHLPGESEPLRQVAFARDPLLNLDGVYGRVCPVTFRYLHSASPAPAAVALLQTSDGTLHARTNAETGAQFVGSLVVGDTIDVPGGFQLQLVDHLRHARRNITFEPVRHAMRGSRPRDTEPAALIELTSGGQTQQVWMRRNDPVYGRRVVDTPDGPLALQLDHARAPLGFSVELLDFVREVNPGNVGNAAFASRVRLVDEPHHVDREDVVSMNAPLTYAGLTLYQSKFDDGGHDGESSTFSVASDPGRPFKYAGGLLVCCGIAIMFYMRAYFFRDVTRGDRPDGRAGPEVAAHSEPVA